MPLSAAAFGTLQNIYSALIYGNKEMCNSATL